MMIIKNTIISTLVFVLLVVVVGQSLAAATSSDVAAPPSLGHEEEEAATRDLVDRDLHHQEEEEEEDQDPKQEEEASSEKNNRNLLDCCDACRYGFPVCYTADCVWGNPSMCRRRNLRSRGGESNLQKEGGDDGPVVEANNKDDDYSKDMKQEEVSKNNRDLFDCCDACMYGLPACYHECGGPHLPWCRRRNLRSRGGESNLQKEEEEDGPVVEASNKNDDYSKDMKQEV